MQSDLTKQGVEKVMKRVHSLTLTITGMMWGEGRQFCSDWAVGVTAVGVQDICVGEVYNTQ